MGQLEDLKEYNAFRVFKELSSRSSASRPELAGATGLTRATVGLLIDYLAERDLVCESGVGTSTGGRPPVLLEANMDAAHTLGAAMYDQQVTVVLANLGGAVIDTVTVRMADETPEAAVASIRKGVELLKDSHYEAWILPRIGIGSPGLVDWHSGIVRSAVDVGWFDVPLGRMVEDSLGVPARVMNRSKLGALAEYWHAGRSVSDLIYVSLGTGIAAGIIHGGELYIGPNSSAGELGHTTILPDGPLCACGNRGCLQALVSEKVLSIAAREKVRLDSAGILGEKFGMHPERLTVFDVLDAAEKDDRVSVEILNDAARYLGIAIANLVNLLNPEKIVLGGPIANSSSRFCSMIGENVRLRSMAFSAAKLAIEQSKLGLEAGAIGAAVLVLQDMEELIFERQSLSGIAVRCTS